MKSAACAGALQPGVSHHHPKQVVWHLATAKGPNLTANQGGCPDDYQGYPQMTCLGGPSQAVSVSVSRGTLDGRNRGAPNPGQMTINPLSLVPIRLMRSRYLCSIMHNALK